MTTEPSLPDLYRAFMSTCATCDPVRELWEAEGSDAERSFVAENLRIGRVLVAGCGHGRGIDGLLASGCEVVALDRDPGMCRSTAERFAADGVEVIQAEIRQAQRLFGLEAFETVLCLGLVSGGLFLPGEDTRAALASLADALTPAGVLLLDFLDPGPEHAEGRTQRFAYPLGEGETTPGCCYWPRPARVRRELGRVGLDFRQVRLMHDPEEPLVGVVARRLAR